MTLNYKGILKIVSMNKSIQNKNNEVKTNTTHGRISFLIYSLRSWV